MDKVISAICGEAYVDNMKSTAVDLFDDERTLFKAGIEPFIDDLLQNGGPVLTRVREHVEKMKAVAKNKYDAFIQVVNYTACGAQREMVVKFAQQEFETFSSWAEWQKNVIGNAVYDKACAQAIEKTMANLPFYKMDDKRAQRLLDILFSKAWNALLRGDDGNEGNIRQIMQRFDEYVFAAEVFCA